MLNKARKLHLNAFHYQEVRRLNPGYDESVPG